MRRLRPFLLVLCCLRLGAAEMPVYLRTALAHFNPDVPRGWAYSVATTRGSEQALEHFDPSAPAGHQWTLLQRNGRAPTAEDVHAYLSYKATNADVVRTTFGRGDIDFGTLQLEHEDAAAAAFSCRFRNDTNDQLLRHLLLTLHVNKQSALIEGFELSLLDPYAPVLTIKTLEFELTTIFSPPGPDRPALPRHCKSHFRGRVLIFKSVTEDLESEYSDFTRVKLGSARAEPADAPQ